MGKAGKLRKKLARLGRPYNAEAPNSFGTQSGSLRINSSIPHSSGLFFNSGIQSSPLPAFNPRGGVGAYGPRSAPPPVPLAAKGFHLISSLHSSLMPPPPPPPPLPSPSRMFFRPPSVLSNITFGNDSDPAAFTSKRLPGISSRPPSLNSIRLPSPNQKANGFRGNAKNIPGSVRNFPPPPPKSGFFTNVKTSSSNSLSHSPALELEPAKNIDFSEDVVPEMGFAFGPTTGSSQNASKGKPASFAVPGPSSSSSNPSVFPSNAVKTVGPSSSTDGNISRSMAAFGRQIPEEQVIAAADFYMMSGKKKRKLKVLRQRFLFIRSENDFKNLQRYATAFGATAQGGGPVSEAENKMLIEMYATTLNMLSVRKVIGSSTGRIDGELRRLHEMRRAAIDPLQAALIANDILRLNQERAKIRAEQRTAVGARDRLVAEEAKRLEEVMGNGM